jgi:outer membrane protein
MRITATGRPAAACILISALLASVACAMNPPRMEGTASTAASADTFWVPPKEEAPAKAAAPETSIPTELADAQHNWSLVDVVDVALRNSPATRAAWEDARAAAAHYGSVRGSYWPEVEVDGEWVRSKSTSSPTSPYLPIAVNTYGPSATLNYLLYDFGGREASVAAARQALIAADFGHNAVLQNTVYEVEAAYFQYMAAKALLIAEQANVQDAQSQLDAANERHTVGVATIADVLQAKTALSRAQLALQQTEGAIQTTRGALAVAMGLPANTTYDIKDVPKDMQVKPFNEAVEALIEAAMAQRPDLAAARAEAEKAAAHVREVQARQYPSITASGGVARTYYDGYGYNADSYSAGVFIRIPVFSGLSKSYDVLEARSQAEATKARTEGLEKQIIFQVWDAFYSHKTATQKVQTTSDLLASATQSREVALARYKAGVGTLLDLMAADSALADARSQRVGAWFDYFTSLVRLAHDTGLLGLGGKNPFVDQTPAPEVKP